MCVCVYSGWGTRPDRHKVTHPLATGAAACPASEYETQIHKQRHVLRMGDKAGPARRHAASPSSVPFRPQPPRPSNPSGPGPIRAQAYPSCPRGRRPRPRCGLQRASGPLGLRTPGLRRRSPCETPRRQGKSGSSPRVPAPRLHRRSGAAARPARTVAPGHGMDRSGPAEARRGAGRAVDSTSSI